jgi:alkylated DNA repair dioxygenase AlkB
MKAIIQQLDDKSEIKYTKNFLSEKDANNLFDELKNNIPWTQGIYNMFGKPVKTPRLLYAMKDDGLDITGSYKVTGSCAWTKLSEKLKKKIEKETDKKITYAQLNYYRDGNDYIGFHTDKEVVKDDIIASISLGSDRKFKFRNIIDKKIKHELILENGSLLIMNDHAAKYNWKHCLPKMKDVGERINLTFRPE